MRRAPLALILGLIMIASPLVAAAANNEGGGQATNAPTVVTLLDPFVKLPGIVVSLDFMAEKNGKVKHSSSADQDPMKFLGGKSKSVGVHLQFNGTGTDIDVEMAALLSFAKVAGASNGPVTMTLVWGHLSAFDVEVTGLNGSAVNITHDHVYQHHQTDFEFVVTRAEQAAVPRDVQFQFPDLGVQAWMIDFNFTPTLNWSKHRESRPDAPELEFTAGAPRSMSFELMFDAYEEGASVKPALSALLDKTFASTSPNATGPVEFAWGNGLVLRGFLVNMSVEGTWFLPSGTPVRASAHGNLSGLFLVEHKGDRGRQVHHPPPVRYQPSISFAEPAVDITATLMAMNAWINGTDGSGEEHVAWQDHRNAEDQPPEFTSAKPMNLSVELLFDDYEQGGNSTVSLRPLNTLHTTATEEKRPPVVIFTWGSSLEFAGVLDSLSIKYTMFLEDGTPVRATARLDIKNASQTLETHARMKARGENGTHLTMPATGHYNPGKAEVADIELVGMITGDRAPMVDWVFGMANGRGSSLTVSLRFRVPSPSAGKWACTQVTYTPQQFGPNGPTDDKLTVHAQVLGLKQGETPTFSEEFQTQRCVIDATAEDNGSHHMARPDEFQKATGFTVDINGSRSAADTFEGGEVTVALVADQKRLGHYQAGTTVWGLIRLTRGAPNATDWGDWYNRSKEGNGGLPLNITINCTDPEGEVVNGWQIFHALPAHWIPPDMDSDKSGMAIERINITVEKVERA